MRIIKCFPYGNNMIQRGDGWHPKHNMSQMTASSYTVSLLYLCVPYCRDGLGCPMKKPGHYHDSSFSFTPSEPMTKHCPFWFINVSQHFSILSPPLKRSCCSSCLNSYKCLKMVLISAVMFSE